MEGWLRKERVTWFVRRRRRKELAGFVLFVKELGGRCRVSVHGEKKEDIAVGCLG